MLNLSTLFLLREPLNTIVFLSPKTDEHQYENSSAIRVYTEVLMTDKYCISQTKPAMIQLTSLMTETAVVVLDL